MDEAVRQVDGRGQRPGGHLSILWDIETGDVHYASGIQSPEQTIAKGRTFADLIKEIDEQATQGATH